ncbi:MAG: ATP-binding cassette domain-containing protein [Oscillospiraceae bacterium]|nr:ATP-binding cassette domain-containing protein [Oscillospiraceae bacterium]
MESYRIENLTFTYPERTRPALDGISAVIERGSFVTLTGPSGSGKTTLLRQLKPTLAPHGVKSGAIRFEGAALDSLPQRTQCAKIGFVMQNPDNQIVTDKVWHELAFGLESLGFNTQTIRLRVAEMASFFGIQTWFHRRVDELSGGQKQILNLASVMAMQPSVLLLDEPTGQLDPIAASEFLSLVGRINRTLGVTVLLIEHRLEEVFPLSDRVIVMDGGRILCDGAPAHVGQALLHRRRDFFLAMPTAMRVWAAVASTSPCPVTVRDGKAWLDARQTTGRDSGALADAPWEPAREAPRRAAPALALDEVWFRHGRDLPDVVKGLSFQAYPGEITALLGGNGTGKTTALSLMAHLYRPYRGQVRIQEQVMGDASNFRSGLLALLPQNPQALFVKKTVRADLWEMLAESKEPDRQARLRQMAALCRLDGLLDVHPYDLSGGEQQRAALAKVLLMRPRILLLDEPTKGLDAALKQMLAGILKSLAAADVTVVMASHDVEFCAEYADRCALLFDGHIVSDGVPRAFFSGHSFYTTGANRMARDIWPQAVTVRDVVRALGGTDPPPGEDRPNDSGGDEPGDSGRPKSGDRTPDGAPPVRRGATSTTQPPPVSRHPLPRRTLAAAGMILLAVPLTIYAGYALFGDRKYYFISLLIILETMLPFALVFERRRPRARELVIMAALCGLAVAGRLAFFMLPQCKPVVALVTLSGVAFGGEAGFLVGALTGFVSNLFFSQGPWTPWQMFALGLIGFLAGVLFRKGRLHRDRGSLALYGGFAAFFLYGGIMNLEMALMYQPQPTGAMLLATYLRGVPFDLIHAAATVFFLFILSKAMLDKLDRIKIKYGLIEYSTTDTHD